MTRKAWKLNLIAMVAAALFAVHVPTVTVGHSHECVCIGEVKTV